MIKIDIPVDMNVTERNFKMALAIIELKEKYTPSDFSKAFGTKERLVEVFDCNDIEEIASHLLAYCTRNRKDLKEIQED